VTVAGVAVAGRARGEAIPPGTPAVVSVRPERLTVSARPPPPPGGGGNTLAGSVEDLSYLGDELKCRVRVGTDLAMVAKIPVQQAREAPPVGATAWLSWEPAHTLVFRRP
jgi:ABC-type Fe3+/spermidine/putrescine transport system ATPase subunit